MATICTAIVKNSGKPCQCKALKGTLFCGKHTPKVKASSGENSPELSPSISPQISTKSDIKKSNTKKNTKQNDKVYEVTKQNEQGLNKEKEASNVLNDSETVNEPGIKPKTFLPKIDPIPPSIPGQINTQLFESLHNLLTIKQQF